MTFRLSSVVRPVEAEWYQPQEQQALARISERDPDDWPALACALTLDCPVWTEDADFFGTGVATWTTSRGPTYKQGPYRPYTFTSRASRNACSGRTWLQSKRHSQ
jgi:hypothetical protein